MIELHLHCRVSADNLDRFHKFLQEAIPYYEAPGGIKVDLLRNEKDPERFIERVGYETEKDYVQDQERIESDPIMNGYLDRWRQLLSEPPRVEVWRTIP